MQFQRNQTIQCNFKASGQSKAISKKEDNPMQAQTSNLLGFACGPLGPGGMTDTMRHMSEARRHAAEPQ